MTFQPPNQGNPPPPPPGPGQPGQFGPPPGGGYPAPGGQGGSGGYGGSGGSGNKPAFDPKTVNPLDWGILAAGVLALIFSTFDYYTVSVSFSGVSESASASAWHGFFGWFAAILALAGAVAIAMDIFAPQVKTPVPRRLAGLGLFALATICVIIALFVFPGDVPDGSGVDTSRGFGYWLSLIVIIAGLVLSLMRFQQTGGVLPGNMGSKVPNIGNRGPQGGSHGGQPTPGGYPPAGNQPPSPGAPSPGAPPSGYQPPPAGYQPPPPPPGYGPPPGQ
jgi:hypothetical protein